MHVYLVRHAKALSPDEDPKRPLSAEGREQAKSVARFLKRQQLVLVNEVWHSTKLRAKQTAEIFVKELALTVPEARKHLEIGIENRVITFCSTHTKKQMSASYEAFEDLRQRKMGQGQRV